MKTISWSPLLATSAFLLLVTAAAWAAPPTTKPSVGLRDKTPTTHALAGARIIVAPGQILDRGTIVIRDGVITAVGADVESPEDARTWDLGGKTIYPGLIDAYSVTSVKASSDGGARHWNSNVQPQRRVADNYTADKNLNTQFRSQGVTARLVAPEGGVIKGVSALVSTGDDGSHRAILDEDVAQHVRLTVSRSRSRSQYPNSPMGAVALARQAMYDADWYARAWQAHHASRNLPRPEQNVALAALQPYRDGGLVIVDASDEQFHLRADRFAREFGLNIAVRGSGREYRRLDAIRDTGRAIILPVDFPKAPNVATAESAARASLRDLMHWDIAPENPARLVEAGVTIALTSHGLKGKDEFLSAVRRAVRRGLASDDALRALTTTPAALLGIEDRLGTIEAGKVAHLVVTDGDLFEKRTKIHETWVDGRRYEIIGQPLVDLRGTWQLRLRGGAGKRPQGLHELELKLAGEPNKLSGTIGLPGDELNEADQDDAPDDGNDDEQATNEEDAENAASNGDDDEESKDSDNDAKTIKLQDVRLRDTRLAFRFDGSKLGDEFDIDGVVRVSVTVTKSTVGEFSWAGQVHWPSGGHSALQATKVAKPDDQAKKDENPEDEDDAAGDEEEKGGGADDSDSADVKQQEAASADDAAEGEKEQDGKEQGQQDDDTEREDKADQPASFPVNYPLGVYGRQAPPEQADLVAFTGATIWTCEELGVLENATVVIGEGKIIAVGADVEVPRGATVIKAQGRHITPGLIDCHSHMATDGGINESGQAITAEVRIGDFIDAGDITIYRQLAGGLTAANVLHGSANPIGGQNQVIKLRWGALPEEMKFGEAPAGIKFALGENVKQSNWGRQYTTRYPQTRMGVEQIICDAFVAAREYRAEHDAWKEKHAGLPPRRDLELDAIAEIVEGERWIHCHSYRQDEILALLRTLEEFGIQIGTLQHILEGYKVADAMAEHGAMASSFSDWWAYKFEVYDAIPYNGALMHNAGVNVSFNSDDWELARHMNQEAAKAVKYGGVPPDEALKFVTLNPAKQLRIEQYVGSLVPGKHADLVVWSGPPLSNFSRAEQCWIDGRKYFDRQDEEQHRKETRDRRATFVQKILKSGQTMTKPGEEKMDERELWPREDIFCHGHEWPHE